MPHQIFTKVCPVCGINFETENKKKKCCTRACAGKSTIPFQRKRTDAEKREQSSQLKKRYAEDPTYKDRISAGVKAARAKNPEKFSRGPEHIRRAGEATKGKYNKSPKSILSLSKRTISKIMGRLNVGCSVCGWKEAVCDIHHINGRKCENADDHDNLAYVCPNCHRLCHTGLIPKEKIVNLRDFIGDLWKDYYFG